MVESRTVVALFFVLVACLSIAVEGQKNGATLHYSAAAIADEVKHLPGWNGPLPTKWFSGMLAISPNMFSHYIYVEREPKSSGPAPLMLWCVLLETGCVRTGGFACELQQSYRIDFTHI